MDEEEKHTLEGYHALLAANAPIAKIRAYAGKLWDYLYVIDEVSHRAWVNYDDAVYYRYDLPGTKHRGIWMCAPESLRYDEMYFNVNVGQ